MHPNRKFQLQDRSAMARLVAEAGFGLLFAQTVDGPRAVHVPVLLDGERLRFHVARGNALHSALVAGCDALFVANGPHAYISPDWYGLEDRVPTWNYAAVELEGRVGPIGEDALIGFLDDMSRAFERRLAPKRPWSRDQMTPGRFEGLVKAITGFEMRISAWRGTVKIDQDKPAEVRARIAEALDGRGDAEMAAWIRTGFPYA